ncbi:hypothetical protein PUN28_005332 [Cardiocondyla obscurior]|uniref:Uncharacterized protein n=1 Tax=Cardiocondyla obscurior TaxID=286306 RepID=A0AAW2GFE1_9HYME
MPVKRIGADKPITPENTCYTTYYQNLIAPTDPGKGQRRRRVGLHCSRLKLRDNQRRVIKIMT